MKQKAEKLSPKQELAAVREMRSRIKEFNALLQEFQLAIIKRKIKKSIKK